MAYCARIIACIRHTTTVELGKLVYARTTRFAFQTSAPSRPATMPAPRPIFATSPCAFSPPRTGRSGTTRQTQKKSARFVRVISPAPQVTYRSWAQSVPAPTVSVALRILPWSPIRGIQVLYLSPALKLRVCTNQTLSVLTNSGNPQ